MADERGELVQFPIQIKARGTLELGTQAADEDGAAKVAQMPDITREEIAARFEAAEARTEASFAQLNGTVDVRFANLDHKMDRIADHIELLVNRVEELRYQVSEVKSDNKQTRITIISIVAASVFAGLAALWVTQSNMLASFQAALTVKEAPSQPPKP